MKVSLNNSNTIALKTLAKPKTPKISHTNSKVMNPITAFGIGVAAVLGQAVVNNVKNNRKTNEAQVDCLLKKNGYVYSRKNDSFEKRYRPDQKNSIIASQDEFEYKKMELLTKEPITRDDVKGFTEFLNLGYGKALSNIDTDFDNVMASYLTLKRNGLFENHKALAEENPEYQNLALTAYNGKIDAVARNALMNYKVDAREIDNFINNGKSVNETTARKVEEISKCLDANRIQKTITVYQTSGKDILNTIKAEDGFQFHLGDDLIRIQNSEDNSERNTEIDTLRNFVANNNLSTKQLGFTRLSLNKISAKDCDNQSVVWEIQVPTGSKGIYLEPYNMKNILSDSNEFLLNKNSTITLKGLVFDRSKNRWIVKAEISSR